MRKKLLIGAGLLLVVIGTISWIRSRGSAPQYETAMPTYESITEVVTETGNITTSATTDVYSTSRGVVTEIYVSNGDDVTTGQDVFFVTSSATEAERASSLASYLSAKAALESAKAKELALKGAMYAKWDTYFSIAEGDNYDDPEDAFRRNLPEFTVPQQNWLAAEAEYKNQQHVVAQAQAALNAAWLQYQETVDTTIKATADGQIHNLAVSVGDSVDIKSVTDRPVMIISGAHPTMMSADFNETDITKVEPGQTARVEIDAIRGEVFDAVVDRVDTIGTNSQGVITYRVYIRVSETDPRMRPAMTGTVDIIVTTKDGVLTVPSSAVKPYQGGRAVRVYNAETKEIEFIPVEIGSKGEDGNTEILSGIDDQTEVIVALKNEQVDRSGSPFGF